MKKIFVLISLLIFSISFAQNQNTTSNKKQLKTKSSKTSLTTTKTPQKKLPLTKPTRVTSPAPTALPKPVPAPTTIPAPAPTQSSTPSSDLTPTITHNESTAPIKTSQQDFEKSYKPKKAVNVDYNSWYEMLGISNAAGRKFGTKATYYGIGIGYDYTIYQEDWGYGFDVGYMQGYGIAGKADDIGTYYQKRSPWTAFRGGARYFSRLNSRIDLGLAFTGLYRQTKWGSDSGFDPIPVTNPVGGFFIDTRWRLNYKLEVIQCIGSFAKDTGIYWRLGINYTLNQ